MDHWLNRSLENLTETVDGILYVEEWRDIPGYEGYYQVSSFGRVKSLSRKSKVAIGYRVIRDRIMRQYIAISGYPSLRLNKNGSTLHLVHRLVMLSFIGPSDLPIDHKSMVKTHNHISNLEYVTHRENHHRYVKSKNRELPMGVYITKNGFVATIKKQGNVYHLGSYKTEEEASNIYNRALNDLENLHLYTKTALKSKYGKGIYKVGERFAAKLTINRIFRYIGTFDTVEEAQNAINEAVQTSHEC